MIGQVEQAILMFFQSIHTPVLDKVMVGLTTLGNAGIIWIIVGIILLARKKSRVAGVMLLSSLLLGLIVGNGIMKNLIARPRPCWRMPEVAMLIPVPTDYSFPSGHTLASFEAITVLFLTKQKPAVFALILGSIIAVSRMYLFVHYPTDILGGMILGIVIGCFSVWIYRKIWKEQREHELI